MSKAFTATITVDLTPDGNNEVSADYRVHSNDPRIDYALENDVPLEEDTMITMCATVMACILLDKQKRGEGEINEGIEKFNVLLLKCAGLYRGGVHIPDPKKN